jgi:hypothetical protein
MRNNDRRQIQRSGLTIVGQATLVGLGPGVLRPEGRNLFFQALSLCPGDPLAQNPVSPSMGWGSILPSMSDFFASHQAFAA